ncbi:hypothetical protein METBIDRAFT_10500 [Metschnikowia bicuspidata var. bicuspidata NRRL YB-4993]|uniref:Uncharacterized protein n=1 Tax=Metschnikowia bicuspidata var. bicuspidata NRRL YB-4993 TaxID=869754 RepID=A0A1A0HK06_9ASCO|nr:hypothetical protein METBIDRAFT_10500 [Metschnikowia bicuspidata var. bicuspidata NRRL YB-4993]OBA24355.1 hypothetical protein METBIDRAFT_10500 [Metschnikowia bicuspidata var. bicuspidata NRRL YB-4993]
MTLHLHVARAAGTCGLYPQDKTALGQKTREPVLACKNISAAGLGVHACCLHAALARASRCGRLAEGVQKAAHRGRPCIATISLRRTGPLFAAGALIPDTAAPSVNKCCTPGDRAQRMGCRGVGLDFLDLAVVGVAVFEFAIEFAIFDFAIFDFAIQFAVFEFAIQFAIKFAIEFAIFDLAIQFAIFDFAIQFAVFDFAIQFAIFDLAVQFAIFDLAVFGVAVCGVAAFEFVVGVADGICRF